MGQIGRFIVVFNMESETCMYSHLDKKVIERIINFEFFDLIMLLKGKFKLKTDPSKQGFRLAKDKVHDNDLTYEPVDEKTECKKVDCYDTWAEAFNL